MKHPYRPPGMSVETKSEARYWFVCASLDMYDDHHGIDLASDDGSDANFTGPTAPTKEKAIEKWNRYWCRVAKELHFGEVEDGSTA